MSPEQIADDEDVEQGNGEFDYRSDWWHFANCLLMLVTAEKPFLDKSEGTTLEECVGFLLDGEYGAELERVTRCTPEFQDLLRMLYKPDPAERPSYQQIITHPWFYPDEQTWQDDQDPRMWIEDVHDIDHHRPISFCSDPYEGPVINAQAAAYLGMWEVPELDVRACTKLRTQRREAGNPVRADFYEHPKGSNDDYDDY